MGDDSIGGDTWGGATDRILSFAEESNLRIEHLTSQLDRLRFRSWLLSLSLLFLVFGTVILVVLWTVPGLGTGSSSLPTWVSASAGVLGALSSVAGGLSVIQLYATRMRLLRERESEFRALGRMVSILHEVRMSFEHSDISALDRALFDIRLARLSIDPREDYRASTDSWSDSLLRRRPARSERSE